MRYAMEDTKNSEFCYMEYLTYLLITKKSVIFERNVYRSENPPYFDVDFIPPSDPSYETLAKILDFEDIRGDNYFGPPLVPLIFRSIDKDKPEFSLNEIIQYVNNTLIMHEHIFLEIGLPRLTLDGRPFFSRTNPSSPWNRINYTPKTLDIESIFWEYSWIGTDMRDEIVRMEMSNLDRRFPSWYYIVDAVRNHNEGFYSYAIILCGIALETTITPILKQWVVDNLFIKDDSLIAQFLQDMGVPFKLNLFIKIGEKKAFKDIAETEKKQIFQELKGMNTIRNNVIHSGYQAKLSESEKSIIAVGNLMTKMLKNE